MKVFLNTPITVSLLLVLALSGSFAPARAEDQPNILLIYLDDFGWRDTGYMVPTFTKHPISIAWPKAG